MDDPAPLVLVVEDDGAVRRALERALTLKQFRVACAVDGLDALNVIAADTPDVILLDVGLPGPDGVSLTKRLRKDGHAVPILMLTARTTVTDRVTGLDAGADDYLTKPFALDELVARLHALLRRTPQANATHVLRFADLTLHTDTYDVFRAGEPVSLTPSEHLLLERLLTTPRMVVSREQLADLLWEDGEAHPNRLEQHVAALRKKLEHDGQPRLIHTVRGVGYVVKQ